MNKILIYTSSLSLIPAFILILKARREMGFINYKNELNALIITYILGDLIMMLLSSFGINNMPMFHVWTLLEFILMVLIFKKSFSKTKQGIFSFLLIFMPLALIANSILFESIFSFNSWAKMITSLILIFLSMAWFIKIFREMKIVKLTDHPMFYINSGVLLYFSGNFFVFTYFNVVANQDWGLMNEIWNIHSILNIIYNLLLAVAIWKMRLKYQPE